MLKKGTIVLRTSKLYGTKAETATGKMFKTTRDNVDGNAAYDKHSAIPKGSFRLATPKEIEAFNNGCKFVEDVDKFLPKIDNYTMY